jgi:hypothetical protein
MTTAKLYEFRAEIECAIGMLEKNPENYYAAISLSRLLEKVNAEITTATAKENKSTSTLAIAKRILKEAASSSVEGMKYAVILNGYQYFCDSFRLLALNHPLPGFPEIPKHISAPDYSQLDAEPAEQNPLELPELAELKSWIKAKKASHKASGAKEKLRLEYCFGESLPTVNAEYLADMLEALPGATAISFPMSRKIISIRFTAENGHGLLMPVRSDKNQRTDLNL